MKFVMIVLALLLLNACGGEQVEESKYEGRTETKKLQAVEAVGYDGDALQKSVDQMLDKNDERNKQLEEAQGQ